LQDNPLHTARSILIVLIVLIVALGTGCTTPAQQTSGSAAGAQRSEDGPASSSPLASARPTPSDETDSSERQGFVYRQGRNLLLDGKPYTFTGLNIYNAASLPNHGCWYGMGTRASVERSLDQIGPRQEVIRTWFFQHQATVDGRRDWGSFDAVLDAARDRRYKVIPVLINQWGDCEGWPDPRAGYKNESWYQTGFRTEPTSPGLRETYEEWVREVVERYREEPTILAWQLVNEAQAQVAYGGACRSSAVASLTSFASHMGRLVKGIDPNHLLSLGTIGSGQCGTRGTEYLTAHAVPEIDLCEYHDYADPRAVPGDRWNGMQLRIAQCAHLDKPLFVGEVGLTASEADGTLEGRARLIRRKVQVQMGAGVVGMLAWVWRDRQHGGSSLDGYEIGPGDPALEALRAA